MTQINYPDIARVSPNGVMRLEIRSPDNDEVNPREDPDNTSRRFWGGFQRNFAFTVKRNDTGDVIWQRNAGADDLLDAPCDAWVSDEGEVIVITRHPFSSHFFVLSATGETLSHYDVADDILGGNAHEIHWTTAGSFWNHHGVGLFFNSVSGRYFCFRTQLGRQVLVNLSTGMLEDANASIADALRSAQSDWSIRTLRIAAEEKALFTPEIEDHDRTFIEQLDLIWSAALFSGADRLNEAVPYLQLLERSVIGSGYTGGWPMPGHDTTWLVQNSLVPIVKQSLRCLNVEPMGKGSYWLAAEACESDESDLGPRIDVPECIADRHVHLATIEPGMSKSDVVNVVGFPDIDWRAGWDYDELLTPDGPYTVRIAWDMDEVASVERVPAAWHDVYARVIWM